MYTYPNYKLIRATRYPEYKRNIVSMYIVLRNALLPDIHVLVMLLNHGAFFFLLNP